MTKGQTPPRRAPTQLILVTNLVRPFTVPQLRELLQRTGNVLDLWVDKIKSKCVAKVRGSFLIEERHFIHHTILISPCCVLSAFCSTSFSPSLSHLLSLVTASFLATI